MPRKKCGVLGFCVVLFCFPEVFKIEFLCFAFCKFLLCLVFLLVLRFVFDICVNVFYIYIFDFRIN